MRARKTQGRDKHEGKGREKRIGGEGERIGILWFCYNLLGCSWVSNFFVNLHSSIEIISNGCRQGMGKDLLFSFSFFFHQL